MIRINFDRGMVWTADDYYFEIGAPERFKLSEKWISEVKEALLKNNTQGAVDVVVLVNSYEAVNPMNNMALQYIYEAINQVLDPEKLHAIREFSVRNFLIPDHQGETVEVLIYDDDSDKT